MHFDNQIKLEQQGEVPLIAVEGDITAFSEPFLNEAYQKANDKSATKILLEIDKEAYINSGGIAVLIQILALTWKNNQKIGIVGISEHHKKIFRMVGITKFADIHSELEEAIAFMSQQT